MHYQICGVAKTVGTTTYGKGVIQSVLSLANGGVLKLTIAEYYTPNGNEINKIGITPDYELELEDSSDEDELDNQIEKALQVIRGES